MITLEERIHQNEGSAEKLRCRALVIAADELIASLLTTVLQAEGLQIVACPSLEEALEEVRFAGFQLVVMDLDAWGEKGLVAIRATQGSDVPAIALSDVDADGVPAREIPRCRILPKPFPMQALRASVHEFLGADSRIEGPLGCVHFGGYTLDLTVRTLSWGGRPVMISGKEMTILIDLVEHAGEPRTARDLYRRLDGPAQGNRNVVPVYVQRLRRKI